MFATKNKELDLRHAQPLQELELENKLLENREQVRFAELHKDRIEFMKQLYHALLDLEYELFDYLKTLQHTTDETQIQPAYERLWKMLQNTNAHYYRHKFYFTEEMCSLIDGVFKSLSDAENAVFGYQYHRPSRQYDGTVGDDMKAFHKKLKEAQEVRTRDLKKALQLLLDEIRRVLGALND